MALTTNVHEFTVLTEQFAKAWRENVTIWNKIYFWDFCKLWIENNAKYVLWFFPNMQPSYAVRKVAENMVNNEFWLKYRRTVACHIVHEEILKFLEPFT